MIPAMMVPTMMGSREPPSVSFQALTSLTTDLTTYTFTGAALGTADSTRRIVAVVTGANANRTISSATIGGVAASIAVQVTGGTNITSGIIIADVPTGTTGDVVVTWSAAQVRCSVAVFAVYNLLSSTAVATASDTAATSSLNVNIQTGDILIVGGCGNAGSSSPTGYSERYDSTDAEGNSHGGGDYTATSTESPRTVTQTWSGTTVRASVAAVFR